MKNTFIALGIVALLSLAGATRLQATSYRSASLKELAQRAKFVALVDVQSSRVVPDVGSDFPRTLYTVKSREVLTGAAPESFEVNVPGGKLGDILYSVPEGATLEEGKAFVIFGGEPHPTGGYSVLDLGLGCFNLREEAGKHFVESILCQRSVLNDSVERDFLFRSIPWPEFARLIPAFAKGENPALPFARTEKRVLQTASFPVIAVNTVASPASTHWLWLLAPLSIGAVVVWQLQKRRANKLARATVLLLCATGLLAGFAGGNGVHAFVAAGGSFFWNLDQVSPGRVEEKRIIWCASIAASKTNSSSFDAVRFAFNKWDNVPKSRLSFREGPLSFITKNAFDGVNVVAWSTAPGLDFSSNVLAITYQRAKMTETRNGFTDCDIIFNDQDFDWNPLGNGDVASVALHEIGHFIGLTHTSDEKTVMFPIDKGLVALSDDEIAGVQSLYPGDGSIALPTEGPTLEVEASPRSGPAALKVSFNANAKPGPSGRPVVRYLWNFGDGQTDSTLLPANEHTYFTRGLYDVTVTAIDDKGIPAYSRIVISVDGSATVRKGSVNLSFGRRERGTISFTLQSPALIGARAEPGFDKVLPAEFYIGALERSFQFDTGTGRSVKGSETQLSINFGSGLATIRLSSTDLPNALKQVGFPNADGPTRLPIGLKLGSNNVVLYGEVLVGVKKTTTQGVSGLVQP